MGAIVPKKLLLCIVILGLTGCAAGPRDADIRVQDDRKPQATSPAAADQAYADADELLGQAEQAEGNRRTDLLLQAAESLQDEQRWQASAAVLSQIEPLVTQNQLTRTQLHGYALLRAQFAAHQQQWQQVDSLLAPLLEPTLSDAYATATLKLARQSHIARSNWTEAANYQLRLITLNEGNGDVEATWQLLSRVTDPDQLQVPTNKTAVGWQRLLRAVHMGLREPTEVTTRLQHWEAEFSDHPGRLIARRFTDVSLPAADRRAVVLLPLTGQYREHGQAVLDGMVMHLARQSRISIEAIDTNQLNFADLPELLRSKPAHLLIGPLLKENIAKIETAWLPDKLLWLTLNEPPPSLLGSDPMRLYFALDGETELRQAVNFMVAQGYQKPLILAPDNSRGQQQISLFTNTWQNHYPSVSVAHGRYKTPDDMKAVVQEQLGVASSEARIQEVKIAAGKVIVDATPRSRGDIDAIYLVGGIEHTRLLKPFIDVNIAPFMQPIPVYANSASHTLGNQISENDLDNVRFTDAPWLLPSHPQHETLEQILTLRRNWSYDLARLAAFGHDSMLFAERAPWIEMVPGFTMDGLTGTLSVRDQRIHRELSWARFDGHRAVSLKKQ
ncbi:penicillin-binding protein activator [Pseudidiomarina sp.]|uniref:penicillin-binding protein activator n=1 Tax=Pseudidiomarina sp. TaxID=2081707 RepID=UPI00299F293A|nr:penicillin-binding protein activator [Pseudidiomarina sp.]MDX1705220.1 penicillin-binding protein activator [Pseudidiomarina sp.]